MEARLRHLRLAPRKVRLIADVVRGMDVGRALLELDHTPNRPATPLAKLLRSAIANAGNNFQVDEKGLYVREIRVDGGPVLKRMRPRAMGRGATIRHRTSHVTIILAVRGAGGEATPAKMPVRGGHQGSVRMVHADEVRGSAGGRDRMGGSESNTRTGGKTQKPQGSVRRIFQRKAI
ncbi:MAG: 50S ribosomal protein L22 [Candidatus Sungbacteria bacterium]|nr:50S ribosomal protein L22 [Candidatus Sungbacteria bacterium]